MQTIIPRNFEVAEHEDQENAKSLLASLHTKHEVIGHVVDGHVVGWLMVKV